MSAPGPNHLLNLLRADRSAGQTAVGVAVVVGLASALVGVGAPVASSHFHQVTAWLDNRDGSVTRVNGLSGRADAQVAVPGTAGQHVRVVQDGSTILVENDSGGTMARIDPQQLSVTQSAAFGTIGDQVVAGNGLTYVVDVHDGTLQRIDPVGLTAIGAPLTVDGGAPVGVPAVDGHGVLWVPVPSQGTVVPVTVGTAGALGAGAPLHIGVAGDVMDVSVVHGTGVFTDATAGTVTIAPAGAAVVTVNLPGGLASSGPDGLLAPAATDGTVLPLLNPGTAQLALVDIGTAAPSAVGVAELTGHILGTPVEHAGRVYIPDATTGSLDVYDEQAGGLAAPIAVSGRPGPLELFEKDGILWANDPDGSDALTVDPQGVPHRVGKYQPDLPGATTPSSPSSSGTNGSGPGPGTGPDTSRPEPPQGTTPTRRHTRPSPTTVPSPTSAAVSSTPTPSPPAQPPGPPGTPRATPNAGWIDVTFSSSTGGTPTSYTLTSSGGGTIAPSSIPAGGPFAFKVTGLACSAQQFTFKVIANYAGGSVTSQATAAVRPCLAPSPPQNVTLTVAGEHTLQATWGAPTSDGGGTVAYDVDLSGHTAKTFPGVGGTSLTIPGLANFQTYSVAVTAANPAGSSAPPVSATRSLDGPTYGANVYNNAVWPVNLRLQASQNSTSLGSFPPNSGIGPGVTVLCQVTGTTYTDPSNTSVTYSIWDKVKALGQTGYIADLYITTPTSKSGKYWTFADPPIWNCN